MLKSEDVDLVASDANKSVFEKIDCLKCGNCCKSAPPVLRTSDIKRISRHLGISKNQFRRKYVLEDINGEESMNLVPCPFLGSDNACSIYEVRPEACARYPFADTSGFATRTNVHEQNVMICPAMYHIVRKMQSKPGFS